MRVIMDHANHIELTYKTIDLDGRVPGAGSIDFLRVEEPYWQGRIYGPFVRVRYALNGVEQEAETLPMDVDKGIFLADCNGTAAESLRPSALKIVEILREHAMQACSKR